MSRLPIKFFSPDVVRGLGIIDLLSYIVSLLQLSLILHEIIYIIGCKSETKRNYQVYNIQMIGRGIGDMKDLFMEITLVVSIIFAIMIWISYHKHFFVFYFNFAHGIVTEIFVSLICGVMITCVTFVFWPIVVLVIGLFAFINVKKTTDEKKKKILIIFAAISCIIVAILGICSWILPSYY